MAITARMVTIDCADPGALATFWTQAAGYAVEENWSGVYIIIGPVEGGAGFRIGLHQVPESKAVKNRVHIDWNTADREAEVARLEGLGASALATHSAGGIAWTVMADPEGNEFCVSSRRD